MSSNFGKIFTISTWGESHGAGIGVTIDGCPAGVPLTVEDIQFYLDRRKPGQNTLTTARSEKDKVEAKTFFDEKDILNTKEISDKCNVELTYNDNLLPIYSNILLT